MKTNKILKSISAILITSVITAGTVIPSFAGQQLGRTDFSQGAGLPWHTYESGMQTKLKFYISGDTYNIEIINPGGKERDGESWEDARFRHNNLTITEGHTYEVHYEITANKDGEFYTRIGKQADDDIWRNLQGETSGVSYDDAWNPIEVTANQKFTFTDTFTADQSGENCKWEFYFGGAGGSYETDAFPSSYLSGESVTLKFANMSLIDLTSDENDWNTEVNPYDNQIHNAVRINQIGYYTNLVKKATLVLADGDMNAYPFVIVDKDGRVVYEGATTHGGSLDRDSGQNIAIIDFSNLNIKGDGFVIKVGGNYTPPANAGTMKTKIGSAESYPFSIGDNIYTDAHSQANLSGNSPEYCNSINYLEYIHHVQTSQQYHYK